MGAMAVGMAARILLVLMVLGVAGCAATDQDRTPLERYLHTRGLE